MDRLALFRKTRDGLAPAAILELELRGYRDVLTAFLKVRLQTLH